jgi:hypothetical protein
MTSSPALRDGAPKEPAMRDTSPRGISLGAGVLWILAIAGGWTIILVLFHNLMVRLLG